MKITLRSATVDQKTKSCRIVAKHLKEVIEESCRVAVPSIKDMTDNSILAVTLDNNYSDRAAKISFARTSTVLFASSLPDQAIYGV